MSAPLDELYLNWLYGQVGSVRLRNKTRTYWFLARQLFTKEFVWLVPNDDNRVEDGRDLRFEFLDACGISADPEWLDLGCSMFELLLGLSRRLAFETDKDSRVWFWHLIAALDLTKYNDKTYNEKARKEIDKALDRVIWRTYDPDGQGGLFPLQDAKRDQRDVELWYQLSAYLLELF